MRSHFHSKLHAAWRPPSLAGTSLVQRMRTTTFALLGFGAAAGLALVAVFAQPGWPLLSPAPLPHEPSASIGRAQATGLGRVAKLPGSVGHRGAGPTIASLPTAAARGGSPAGGGVDGRAHEHGSIGSPQPVGSSPSTGAGAAGAVHHEAAPEVVPTPAPEPAPAAGPGASPAPEKTTADHSAAAAAHSAAPPGHSTSAAGRTGSQADEHSGSKDEEGSSYGRARPVPAGHSPAKAPPKPPHASPRSKGSHAAAPPPPPSPPSAKAAEPSESEPPAPPGKGKGNGPDK